MDPIFQRLNQSLTMDLDAESFIKNYPESKKNTNKKLVKKVIEGEFKKGLDNITSLFAHGECAVYSEGLITTLSSVGYDPKLLILKENGNPIHYLAEIQHNGKNLFIDAYGVFDSLDTIKNRYEENHVDEVIKIDIDKDSDAIDCEIWRDRTVGFMDAFDDEEVAEENDCHYSELYDDYLERLVAENFESIFFQNKELAKSIKLKSDTSLSI